MADDDRIWALIEDQPVCMMISVAEQGGLHGRPMHAVVERAAREILFYTRVSAGKCSEIGDDPQVCLAFAAPKTNDYVSVTGVATVTQDRALIRKHWSRFVDAWFPDGPDGREVGMIVVRPTRGEYWDGESSSILAALKMVTASVRDETPDMGENEKVRF